MKKFGLLFAILLLPFVAWADPPFDFHSGPCAFASPGAGTSGPVACQPGTGTGSPVFSNSPTLVSPALGTPASGVATNLTGTATGMTVGAANGLKSASTTVSTSAATAPSSGQILTATSSTTATWQNAPLIVTGYINGFTLSNDGGAPNSVLDIAAGYAADSTNSVMMTGTAFTKTTGGTWTAGTGNAGMGSGLTIANSTWYHAFAIINNGSYDVYFDTSASAANKPASTTAFRYIGSFRTDSSAHIITFTQRGQYFMWGAYFTDVSGGTGSAAATLTTPLGFVTKPILMAWILGNSTQPSVQIISGTGSNPDCYFASLTNSTGGQASIMGYECTAAFTNTSSQISYVVTASDQLFKLYTMGYMNPHVAPNW